MSAVNTVPNNGEEKSLPTENSSEVTSELGWKVSILPKKETWQKFTTWRVNVMKGALVFSFHGDDGSIIYIDRKGIEGVFRNIDIEWGFTKGRSTFHLQKNLDEHILRSLERNRGTNYQDWVSFKFIWVNYGSGQAVIYQNIFEALNSKEMKTLVQFTAISLQIEELLDPMRHLVAVVIERTDEVELSEEDDV